MPDFFLAALFLPFWLASPVSMRDGPVIDSAPGSIAFLGKGWFTARVRTSEKMSASRLILESGSSRFVFRPTVDEGTGGYTLVVDDPKLETPLFPFSFVKYWWEVDFQNGTGIASLAQTFQYSDTRFDWKRRTDRRVTVGWVEGDGEGADDAVELALLALGTVSADLEAPIPESIAVYIYPRLADMQSALGGRSGGWEGGVADPETGIILTAAAPGAEGRQTLAVLIPHEITHILLAAKWNAAYAALPLWLVEGTAAGYEMGPRPEADRALREAADQGGLIPIPTLCGVFPSDEGAALLAYAESKSFVAFLKEKFGLAALRQGMAAYAGGADCGRGMEAPTGKSLTELESDWIGGLHPAQAWIPPAWSFVLAGFLLLAGLLFLQMLIRRGKKRPPAGKEGAR
jgi:hypothetical protein